jgi:hypothetical protein
MESFEPAAAPDQMVARLEVVARHAASALYNAAEHKRIPMRFLWMPLAKLQDGLGGKAKAIWTIIGVAFLVFVLAMVFVPYPLKMEANGTMLPIQRAWLFPPAPGFVEDIKPNLKSGTRVFKDEELIRMFDDGLAKQVGELQLQIQNAHSKIQTLKRQQTTDRDRNAVTSEIEEATHTIAVRSQQLAALRERHKASLERPGQFMLRSPMSGIVLTSDFRETLKGRPVKPNEPLLRIGVADLKNPKLSDWEAEVKIPQKHIGQVLRAFDYPDAAEKGELWVDLLLVSYPTRTFKGKLARDKISPEAKPHQDEHGESEPVVVAWVRVHGNDIPEEYRIPPELLRTAGTEVRARVRCGNHAMGYSLFYGVWEFIYEKIVFFF